MNNLNFYEDNGHRCFKAILFSQVQPLGIAEKTEKGGSVLTINALQEKSEARWKKVFEKLSWVANSEELRITAGLKNDCTEQLRQLVARGLVRQLNKAKRNFLIRWEWRNDDRP